MMHVLEHLFFVCDFCKLEVDRPGARDLFPPEGWRFVHELADGGRGGDRVYTKLACPACGEKQPKRAAR